MASTQETYTYSLESDGAPNEEAVVGDDAGALFKVLVCLLGVVGLVGNAIVLIVMIGGKKTRKQITGRLIINQSLVDLICAVSIILTYGYSMKPVQRYDVRGREALCYLLVDEILLFNSMNASTYSLMVITIERYMMIVMPIFHRNHFTKQLALVMVVVAWLAGYLWNSPPTLLTTSIDDNGQCIPFAWDDLEAQMNFGITYVTATFFAPMLFFALAYSHMGWVLRKRAVQLGIEPNAAAPSGDQKTKLTKSQVNVTKTMVMITAAFAICWTPNQVFYLMFNLGYDLSNFYTVYLVTLFMSLVNTCVNPCIYAFKLEAFRQGTMKYRQYLPSRCKTDPGPLVSEDTATSHIDHLARLPLKNLRLSNWSRDQDAIREENECNVMSYFAYMVICRSSHRHFSLEFSLKQKTHHKNCETTQRYKHFRLWRQRSDEAHLNIHRVFRVQSKAAHDHPLRVQLFFHLGRRCDLFVRLLLWIRTEVNNEAGWPHLLIKKLTQMPRSTC
ncbi:hypothetical protein CAPTEDRAFT_215621 [Capitella teleta]|uniref:G-protein coupled receptors family 1 profile domain-containing protein n=1 Tax=Capitella teleta TaxID=283909 RepID=R7V3Y6_CAPTE|nr:hypothetical protein CAPTEDRAFT_215621 [Capitella teleta]|eukprot:ELU11066.1 hypothetical protein CAPTEDRAFT_215621 [Capitella teleta]